MGEVFNSVAYERRLNVLNTLIDNNIKVKKILEEPILNLDAINNDYLFEKSLRNNSQKLQVPSKSPSQYSLGCKENPI